MKMSIHNKSISRSVSRDESQEIPWSSSYQNIGTVVIGSAVNSNSRSDDHGSGLLNSGLRKSWIRERSQINLLANENSSSSGVNFVRENISYHSIPIADDERRDEPTVYLEKQYSIDQQSHPRTLVAIISALPGLLIAIILNMFLSVSFGQALFPSSMIMPSGVPRSLGIQV